MRNTLIRPIAELLGVPALASRSRPAAVLVFAVCVSLVFAIGGGAYLSGYEVRLSVLYLAPIALATWMLSPRAGVIITGVSAASWTITFWLSHPHSGPIYFYWEGGLTIAMFLVFVALLAGLRDALARADARLLTVLEGLQAAVYVEDSASGACLYRNRQFSETFGSSRRFSQETGEIYDAETRSWYLLQSRTLRWTDGRQVVLRLLSDVTSEHAAREALTRQRDTAHRTARMVALGEFASGIAHELNQPLTAISTYNDACLRLLDADSYDSKELREAMQRCRDQARRAAAIIQRLREILRHPVRPATHIDLREIASRVRQIAEPDALEAGVVLVLDPVEQLPLLRSDQVLVEQVTLNLVRNAIDAVRNLPPARRRVTIATGLEGKRSAVMAVSDLGEGVPPEVKSRIFEAFVTTKPDGLGLGLRICRSVVESLGGSIRYDTNPSLGARFSFTLPVAEQ